MIKMDEEIMVSICCLAYNHENYIKEAIEGFLMQKVNFKYEIIIHDDASTDNTQKIIKEYEKKYPEIIKPIYQTENQYSQGKRGMLIMLEKAKGKYIAFCEGDDYWIDIDKLKTQVEYMEENPDCSFCFHNAKILDITNKEEKTFIPLNRLQKNYLKKEGNYSAGELALLGFIPTASFLFRAKHIVNIPKWYSKAIAGDITFRLVMTSMGYAHYIDKIMSVYRVGNSNSMSSKWQKENKEAIIDRFSEIYTYMDEFTNGKWKNEFDTCKKYKELDKLVIKNDLKKIYSKEYKKYYKIQYGIKERIKSIAKYVVHKAKRKKETYGEK